MKPVAGIKESGGHQLTLWEWVGDRPLLTDAALRTHTGDFFEEAAASLLDANRIKTDSRCICPDLQHRESVLSYCEVKSIGRNRQGLLYEHRIEKYEQLAADTGARIYYLFWFHHAVCRAAECQTLFGLHQRLSECEDGALLVPMDVVHERARQCTLTKCNYRGYKDDPRREIMWGRRIPGGWFREIQNGAEPTMAWDVRAYGTTIRGTTVTYVAGADWP